MTNYAFSTFSTLNVVPIEHHTPVCANTGRFDLNANLDLRTITVQYSAGELIRRAQFRGNSNLETYNVPYNLFTPTCTFSRTTCASVNPVIKRSNTLRWSDAMRVRARKSESGFKEQFTISGALCARDTSGDHRPGSFSTSKRVSN